MKEAKFNRGGTVVLCTDTGHSMPLTKSWRRLPPPLEDVAKNTPGVDIRDQPARGRPPKNPQQKVTHEEVSESISAKAGT